MHSTRRQRITSPSCRDVVTAVGLVAALMTARAGDVHLHEDFDDLTRWKPLLFPKIARHSRYRVVEEDGNQVLRGDADASASGVILKQTFDVRRFPKLRWRWKVSNTYRHGNATRKDGDDYPLRVYVVFAYDPDKAGFRQRMAYGVAKKLYGRYPPEAGLNYIWANRPHTARILTSPYTDRAKMVPLRQGDAEAGQWREETVDIVRDFRAAFGREPPRRASLAIMTDADNTGEKATGFVDFIEIYRDRPDGRTKGNLKESTK